MPPMLAVIQRSQRMEEALRKCDLITLGQYFPDLHREVQSALAFDPLSNV
jgi:hypothetical protein